MTVVPRLISVDDHVLEPPDLWWSRLPSKLREQGPYVRRERGTMADPVKGPWIALTGYRRFVKHGITYRKCRMLISGQDRGVSMGCGLIHMPSIRTSKQTAELFSPTNSAVGSSFSKFQSENEAIATGLAFAAMPVALAVRRT